MEKMQEILSNEGGTPVFNTYAVEIGGALWDAIYNYVWEKQHDEDYNCVLSIYGIYEEGDQKFAILRNRQDLKFFRLNFSLDETNGFVPAEDLILVEQDFAPVNEESQFALSDIEAYETTFAASKKPVIEEEIVTPEVEETVEEEPAATTYNLEEVTEYVELKALYEELQTKFNEAAETISQLNSQIEQLTTANNELVEFKRVIDRDKKMDLITNTFYMLSDDLKKDCVDNIDTYSYDDIEAKLSVICVRNKVSFDLDKPMEHEPVVFNLDNINVSDNGVPNWVARVQEVAKEKNI